MRVGRWDLQPQGGQVGGAAMSKSEDNELRARSLESDAKSHTAAAARYGRCTDLAERRLDAARECLEKATELKTDSDE